MLEIKEAQRNAVNYGEDKEMIRAMSVVDCSAKREVLTVRWYRGRSRGASRVYCSLWFRGVSDRSGTAWAGGYGYDKRTAAFHDALRSAGIEANADGKEPHAVIEELMREFSDTEDYIITLHG